MWINIKVGAHEINSLLFNIINKKLGREPSLDQATHSTERAILLLNAVQETIELRNECHILLVLARLVCFRRAQNTLLILARLQTEQLAHCEHDESEDVAFVQDVTVVHVRVRQDV